MLSTEIVLNKIKDTAEVFNNGVQVTLMQYFDTGLFNVKYTSEVTEKFTSNEGTSGTRYLAEAETGDEYKLQEGYQTILTENIFGGYLEVTEKLRRRDANDSTMNVDGFLAEQTAQAIRDNERFFLTEIFKLYNEALSSTLYKAPDTANAADTHTWKSGLTFTNKGTVKMSQTLLDNVEAYGGAFKDASGKEMPLDFDMVVVKKGSAAAVAARKLLLGGFNMVPTKVGDINIYQGTKTIIETPYITNADYVYFIASRVMNAFYVGIGEMPTMRNPIEHKNGSVSTRISGFFKFGINNMPYFLYVSDGTTGSYPA